ncbi:SAM-dependent methyltransferase [Actinokineospora sp. NBRC 105648]|uniref:SAM-dependent methyltransferase n=1 Tax=Actinokineospora sp. NBRC 105648 TaxID=3032206 RepID=UPI0024A2F75F|nr:SAM-dependent methyltransferase [Actinokineospora sp. NBRC 105648]GLZ42412.1 hypothetical protein Acsp05_60360 [Actinokineospora sp. NBRC 105648]
MTEIDPERPHPARIYDYLLGGACNFEPDRAFAERFLTVMPNAAAAARTNRAFLRRVVEYYLSQGVRQFLDLGSGIPSVGNVHEIAPGAPVVYVDNDPIAVAHSEIVLREVPNAAAVLGDLREPEAVLATDAVSRLLDLDQPVGVLMLAVLHFVADAGQAIDRYAAAVAPGSHFAITHGTADAQPEAEADVLRLYAGTGSPAVPRNLAEVGGLCAGLTVIDPGVVWTPLWRPDAPASGDPTMAMTYAVVARKDL